MFLALRTQVALDVTVFLGTVCLVTADCFKLFGLRGHILIGRIEMLGFFFFLGGRLSSSLGDFQPVLVTVGCESARQGCFLSVPSGSCPLCRNLPLHHVSGCPGRRGPGWSRVPVKKVGTVIQDVLFSDILLRSRCCVGCCPRVP